MVRKKASQVDAMSDDGQAPTTTISLNDLLGDECVNALDLVDELRSCGLDSIFQLPQLVVCGDQSAGKSSVLEALTEVPFPTKENLCTRFATQIVIRRSSSEAIRTKIIPDDRLGPQEKAHMGEFDRTIQDFAELPALIDAATEHMGLNKPIQAQGKTNTNSSKQKFKAFSRNVLSVEIEGPDRRPLTLVDLPGWINTPTMHHTEEDMKLIQQLIGDYIKQERTVILAVISAKSDLATQTILTKCQEVDPNGRRTLGIITKPDTVPAGSDSEKDWLEVARNRNIPLELGWHILKNRSYEERRVSFESRNKIEKDFFKRGAYKTIPPNAKGIDALGERVSELLYDILKRELPKLLTEADARYHETVNELKQLGQQRSTLDEQRKVLTSASVDFFQIVQNAYDGSFKGAFFGNRSLEGYRFLRSTVAGYQEEFTAQMQMYGAKFRIYETQDSGGTHKPDSIERTLSEQYKFARKLQKEMKRGEVDEWAMSVYLSTRGLDLPGTFDSALVGRLFQEMSAHWDEIAQEHITIIDTLCRQLVKAAIHFATSDDLAKNIWKRLDLVLKRRFGNAHRELKRLIDDKNGPLTIYDPYYADTVQRLHDHKINNELEQAKALAVHPPANATSTTVFGLQHQSQPLQQMRKLDNNVLAARKAVDHMIVILNKRLETFAENVTQQVIERNLLKDLAEATFSPKIVQKYTDEMVSELAVESKFVTLKRTQLEHYRGILEKSKNAVDKLLNPHKRRATELLEDEDDPSVPYSKRAALE
ncbi:hypothetical protein M409DRAFT_54601 [Zasmidium cellare ATCC 36951]|uniref:GED domain-containing protein n=1 Tax=Zasmidium cellare ATCC 36951 TaxID=1080233 RepID=A0A6A6CKY6_ZASCE|nr:uncharacterized protein M409DRAFT_54601 [Zasmidium cellare ATCC 36951]KAF2166820.1 hypothetical protein M409DRAFT_54601 [Zasmidium cellare ATCC 36951]